MRKASDLLKEFGFNPDAPLDTQAALIKSLIRAAHELVLSEQQIHHLREVDAALHLTDSESPQLSFDFEATEVSTPEFTRYKRAR